jgi:transposase
VVVPLLGLAGTPLYDQRFGRGLDDLHAILAPAWVTFAARVVQQEGVDLSVLHWDTTAIYLEGEYDESALAAYGHSREHPAHKQVKVGLDVTSRERVPLLYRLLNGATADVSTAVPNLAAIAAFLRQPECAPLAIHPLVVGDCKMITPAAVAAAHQHHLYYLGPWASDTTVQAVIRSVSDARSAGGPRVELPAAAAFPG